MTDQKPSERICTRIATLINEHCYEPMEAFRSALLTYLDEQHAAHPAPDPNEVARLREEVERLRRILSDVNESAGGVNEPITVAALYVARGGCYWDLHGVDAWDLERDARLYAGPWPVVAHPPCERWGRYWYGGPSAKVRRVKGDEGGCFAAALASVRKWGGVLEHPEASAAWAAFGLNKPPKCGGWVNADLLGGWTCCVEQGHYGHRAQKATWLYAHGCELPVLRWGPSISEAQLDDGFHSAEERKAFRSNRTLSPEMARKKKDWMDRVEAQTGRKFFKRLTDSECAATPVPFRDLLLSMARSARGRAVA